ncbi:MAG: hypothetical protein ABR567_12205 [Myxococcales bacterium]
MFKKFVVIAAVALATSATAGDQAAARPSVQRPRRTILHFGEDDIRGDITRPDGELVQAPRKVADQSLLRVRRSFVDRALAAPLGGR